jgi:hypothetical protein
MLPTLPHHLGSRLAGDHLAISAVGQSKNSCVREKVEVRAKWRLFFSVLLFFSTESASLHNLYSNAFSTREELTFKRRDKQLKHHERTRAIRAFPPDKRYTNHGLLAGGPVPAAAAAGSGAARGGFKIKKQKAGAFAAAEISQAADEEELLDY